MLNNTIKTDDTKLLYNVNQYTTKATATIIKFDFTEDPEIIRLELDQTIFYPEGGGQSSDKGKINGFPVTHVSKSQGIVSHFVDYSADVDSYLELGDTVTLEIDWNHRFDNMQRHSGEHILSGMFFQEVGGINRGFAMGDNYMTLDISLEALPSSPTRRPLNEAVTCITQDDIDQIEHLSNMAIWQNVKSSIRYFENGSEANKVPLRKKVSIESKVSIVSIGSESNPANCVACSGTHVSQAGEIGLIKILKWENYKGMYRIYAEAGQRALANYKNTHNLIQNLCVDYSANQNDLLEKIKSKDEKNSAMKADYVELQKEIIKLYIAQIDKDCKISKYSSHLHYDCSKVNPDLLFNLDKEITLPDDLLISIICKGNTVILISKNLDCKDLTEKAKSFGGRGGGKPNKVRISFENQASIVQFISIIK